MNTPPNTPTPNKRKGILQLLLAMLAMFVFFFTWLGLVILFAKMDLELSAERLFLGVIALAIGGAWVWLSLKGRMPLQEGETLLSPPPPARNPIEKLMRGLFFLVGIAVYVAVAMLPDAIVSSFLRIFSFGRVGDTLGMLALLGMLLVAGVVYRISAIKNKLSPHKKSEEYNPYAHWYVTTMLNWVLFFVVIVLGMYMIERLVK
ncbi:conserved membrane hypothetical protein [Capnocytophaga canis]|uniref:Uncharacterized protein n=1 Tax=Capnocytophaga canis TaxID=1848903 RepID=A0A0B7HYE4_9FLAO|nr:hypothetical protein [Capnocytophaga canis]CEN42558.1 conserved membrane hypothetical protein [Capnocytophaga canis]CEN47549.1 conserved membrane hypothetical protein [Capnocytophaga canis]